MKHLRILLVASMAIFLFSCSKDKSAEKPETNPNQETFQPTTAGSQWHYKDGTGNNAGFTLTATGRDTVIGGRSYAVLDNKPDTSSNTMEAFFGKDNNDYYIQSVFAGIGDDPVLYYKDSTAVQTSWTQDITVNQAGIGEIDAQMTFTLVSTNATVQVNGVSYKNTSEVDLKLTAGGGSVPLGTGTLLLSRGVGILSLNIKTGISTAADYVLDSYSIK